MEKVVLRDKRLMDLGRRIVPVLKRNKVVRAGIFGSFARGDFKRGSDIDILIEVKAKKFSLFDLVGLELELKKVLGRDVDLLTYNGINPLLRDRILGEEVRII
ncbi:MAG: nucleotidyltransferase family protein [Candidatus Altiarchaeota archaeon]|nr:nucleotidyltransferase family protein [Candidatus Altiarchaeota archaeon]